MLCEFIFVSGVCKTVFSKKSCFTFGGTSKRTKSFGKEGVDVPQPIR
jgi:hypothetical protein